MSDPAGHRRSKPRSTRARLRSALLVLVGMLFLVSIPWYRNGEDPGALWFGLPEWVAVAIGCYVLAAVANAAAWLLTEISDGAPGDPE